MLKHIRRKTVRASLAAVILLGFLILGWQLAAPAVEAFKESRNEANAKRQLLKTYSALGGAFKYQLPDAWNVTEESFSGGEIIYHMYFTSKDKKVNGFVQVWNLDKPLKQFLDESKTAAVGAVDFKFYDTKEIMADNKQGYLIDYSRPNANGEYYRGYEAFIEGGDKKIYRISFFVLEKDWESYYPILFDRIIHSMDIKG